MTTLKPSHHCLSSDAVETIRIAPGRGVTAVLGPTNTGKTHLAIERMVSHETGIMGLPLRLLAREVYTKVVAKVGVHNVALVTGEEKIVPDMPRFWICTVEAMPLDLTVSFVAIDEVQLAHTLERGHIFTDRLLNMRGTQETLLLGASTARPVLEQLIANLNVITRPRLSELGYVGSKKISRLPRRSAIVAFSSQDVYAIAELIRRQSGGAAVVLGSLSPRTRNAQVDLFQRGDVDYLVATDAIGMGLNLDVTHVALAATHKFDGFQFRNLTPAELGQIVGRAGRYTQNGTFGVTSRVDPFDAPLAEQLESHSFEPLKMFQWRTAKLDFSSMRALRESFDVAPSSPCLVKAPVSDDITTLEAAMRDAQTCDRVITSHDVARLWDVCCLPDYRKIAPAEHADLVLTVFEQLQKHGTIKEDWFASQIAHADRLDGDIDTLSNRIAHVRTWTYLANRHDWLDRAAHWREETRQVEDRLSDALHEKLTQRFVDRRTSVLMKKLRESTMLEASITNDGDVIVADENIGKLEGLRFSPDAAARSGPEAKTLRCAAQKALATEIDKRAERINKAPNEAFLISSDNTIRWLGAVIARLTKGDDDLTPGFIVLADEQLTGPALDKVTARLRLWLDTHIATVLQPLVALKKAEELEGLARGIAFQLVEKCGVIDRRDIANDIKNMDQPARGSLRKLGVRFGAYHIYIPALLKPAACSLLALLWGLKHEQSDNPGISEVPALAASGRTSFDINPDIPVDLYRVAGYKVAEDRAVRVDILERLADIIRPIIAWRPSEADPTPPPGGLDEFGFTTTVAMTSLLGCSGDNFAKVLKAIGYRMERREVKAVDQSKAEPRCETEAAETPEAVTDDTAKSTEEETTSEETTSDSVSDAPENPVPESTTQEKASAEPIFIEIWRPQPANTNPNKRNTHKPKEKAQKQRSKGHKAKSGAKTEKPKQFSKPKDKPLDPDSPFAKLAALKDGLGK